MKYKISILSLILVSMLLIACASNNVSTNEAALSENTVEEVVSNTLKEEGDEMPPAKVYSLSGNMVAKLSKYDQLIYYNEDTATKITCKDGAVSINGAGAFINGNQISIVEEGTYIVRGQFADNTLFINTEPDKKIHLVLDGADIACNTTSPIYGAYGDKLIITLADNSVNSLSDTVNHANDAGNGCLYGNMDVTINGKGTLNITANYNSGIQVKKDLKIYESTIVIEANNNGIKGNNSAQIIDANITIAAKGDGIKVSEDEDKSKGFIFITGGIIEITADDDVLQATNGCVIRDSDVRGRCYGSLVNCKAGYVEGEEIIVRWE